MVPKCQDLVHFGSKFKLKYIALKAHQFVEPTQATAHTVHLTAHCFTVILDSQPAKHTQTNGKR